MILSNNDVKRINKMGFGTKFFVTQKNGWMHLKNQGGRCVFHDRTKCLIYRSRPDGCRLYPVIFDMERGCAVLDNDCPYKDEFRLSKSEVKKLYDVISKIKYEQAKR
jgi:Fe-S-cluster containining protein